MLDRKKLLAGTRPTIDGGRILMTGSDQFDGYEIIAYRGMCWGIAVRSKDMGQDCAMGIKTMTGGELNSYTQLADETRQRAVDRLLEMAARQKANAVINIEFELSGAGAAQVVVYGTGVSIQPVEGYVPTGAIGNILAELVDQGSRRESAGSSTDAPGEENNENGPD